jgi:hypothetical protein
MFKVATATILGLLLASTCAGQTGTNATTARSTPDSLTGPRFRVELDQATSGSWLNVELRTLFNKLSAERRIAILLDRRVDPSVQMPVEITNRSLREGLEDIARKVQAHVSVPDNVVFVGPEPAAARIRTLIELRSAELQSKSGPVREARRNELTRPSTTAWPDLTPPDEIIQQIADRRHLTIRGLDKIPHDLWAGNSLPAVTAPEALSLVLIQFDLTFAWIDGGQGIELVPVPDTVTVERRVKAKGRTPADTQKLIAEQFPDLDAKIDGGDVVVRGTVEQHEMIAALLNPTSTRPTVKAPAPLKQRSFTLEFRRVPISAAMKKLEESGVVFAYDAVALKAAGVDLDQTVDIKLNKATATEFFDALFAPANVSFQIDNVTVKLTPRR